MNTVRRRGIVLIVVLIVACSFRSALFVRIWSHTMSPPASGVGYALLVDSATDFAKAFFARTSDCTDAGGVFDNPDMFRGRTV